MTIDLDAIEAAARAALTDRPEPWAAHEDRYRHRCLVDTNKVTIIEQEAGDVDPDVLAHLVATQPATVLALVARIRELEEDLYGLRVHVRGHVQSVKSQLDALAELAAIRRTT